MNKTVQELSRTVRQPPSRSHQISAVTVESRAFALALFMMLASTPVAFFIFLGSRPTLSGDGSVGQLSSIFTALICAIVFVLSYIFSFRLPDSEWLRQTALIRRVLDVAALAFAHAAIAFMLAQAAFYIFQNAFAGLTLDPFAASLFVGISSAAGCYTVALSGARITTYTLSNLLAVFLVTGALTAMITAENTSWWQINFSVLGTSTIGLSAYAFNATLIISGLVITTLASYMTRDLRRWSELSGHSRTRAKAVQWTLVSLGLLLSGVGAVPVDLFQPLHNLLATGMIFAFMTLVIGMHFWLPDFPRSFFLTSYVLLSGVGLAVVLFWPLGYYNLTGMELAATALIFGWLVLFIRNTAALVTDASAGRSPADIVAGAALPEATK